MIYRTRFVDQTTIIAFDGAPLAGFAEWAKKSTIGVNESFVHPGFLLYKDCPNEQWTAVVFVTHVFYLPLKQAVEIEGFDEHTPDIETGLNQMQSHYPDITLNTPVLLALHLSVSETKQKYPKEVKDILEIANH